MDFYIESARFKDGKIHDSKGVDTLKFKRINIFIGANNSGKTQILKDLLKKFGFNPAKQDDVLLDRNSIKVVHPDNEDEFISEYHLNLEKTDSSIRAIGMPCDFNSAIQNPYLSKNTFEHAFDNETNFDNVLPQIGVSLCTHLSSDYRLQLIDPVEKISIKSKNGTAKTIYDGIFESNDPDEKIRKIDSWFYKVSGVHTWLTNFAPEDITFRYNMTKSSLSGSNLIKRQSGIAKTYRPMSEQGDGMRALLGMLCGIYCNDKPIIFIDEPEAYLHPGQAYLFGRYLSQIIGENRQVFISTHSADFLRGIFFSAYDDVAVTRLYRHMDDTVDCYQLDNQKLEEISKDNVSSTYNILDGLFHPACVVCEGDKDVLIYQSMFDKINPTSDIHVFPTTGMGGVANATDLYRTMNIKHAIILDCDCLLNTNPTNQDLNCPVISVFNKYVSDLDIKKQLKDLLSQLNSAFTIVYDPNTGNPKGIDKDERNKFKSSLKDCLKEKGMEQCFEDINKLVNTYGIFITQEGQLEAWFQDDVSINTNFKENDSKQERYEKIVNSLYSKPDDELINTELGKFIGNIVKYFN